MKKILAIIAASLALAGCSSFNLGSMLYCPAKAECKFEKGKLSWNKAFGVGYSASSTVVMTTEVKV